MNQKQLDVLVATIVCTAIVLLGAWLGGCGGEGGDVNATGKGTTATADGSPVLCDFGDGNTFTFTVGDNAALDFCTETGGVVTPDNSTNNTDSGNRTSVNGATPTPTPSP